MRMCHSVFCGLPGSTKYFYLISKTKPFSKKKLLNIKMCVLIFSTNLSEISFILEELSEILLKMYIGLHVKCPVFLSDFHETWIFSTIFSKNIQISNFMKICSVGGRVVACGQTDRHDEANFFFLRFFAKAPNKRRGRHSWWSVDVVKSCPCISPFILHLNLFNFFVLIFSFPSSHLNIPPRFLISEFLSPHHPFFVSFLSSPALVSVLYISYFFLLSSSRIV